MAFTYRQVKDLYDTLADSGAITKSLPEWSREMSSMTGSDLYDAGLHDNVIKRASVGLDRILEDTGAAHVGQEFGRGVGGVFGMADTGAEIGHGLPRMMVNFAPAIAASVLSGGTAPLIAGLGMLGTGALSGAETYTATDSPAAGVLSGAVNAFLPKIVHGVEKKILSRMIQPGIFGGVGVANVAGNIGTQWESAVGEGVVGNFASSNGIPTAVRAVNELYPSTIGQRGAAFLGGQVGAAGIMGASELGQQALAGQPISNPFTPEFALGLGLSQLPFAGLSGISRVAGRGGVSPIEQGRSMQRMVDVTTKGLAMKEARDMAAQTPEVAKEVPQPTPIARTPEELANIKANTDKVLASLKGQREAIEANPTPENIEELAKIKEKEDALVASQVETSGGVGLGFSRPETGTVAVTGEGHSYLNHKGLPETGFHHITIKENPGDQLKYADGTPVRPGDRIRFPAGRRDPEVNQDGTENFRVPRNPEKFLKVVDKAMETKVIEESKQPELPDQSRGDLAGHIERLKKVEAEHIVRVKEHEDRIAALADIQNELSLKGALSYAEVIENLEKINAIRAEAGYPEVDFATFLKGQAKINAKSRKSGLISLSEETKRFDLIEAAAHSDYLVGLQGEVDVQSRMVDLAKTGDQNAHKILELYRRLSEDAGRRSDIAASWDGGSAYWKRAAALEKQGLLTPTRMAAWGKTIQTGEGLTKAKAEAPLPPTAFEALTQEEESIRLKGAEMIIKVLAGDKSEEAQVLRHLAVTGSNPKDVESVAGAFEELRIVEGTDAEIAAREWAENPKVLAWQEALNKLKVENEAPEPQGLPASDIIEGEFFISDNNSPFGPGEQERAEPKTQPPAGGGFVWGLAPIEPIQTKKGEQYKLGGKVTVPGTISEKQLKDFGGRGKPLQDVEIEMMKLVDQAIGGGAFDGKGNVNVKALEGTVRQAMETIEVHVYGQEGKVSENKAEHDRLEGELDIVKNRWSPELKKWEENEGWLPTDETSAKELEQEAISKGMAPEQAVKYARANWLKNIVAGEKTSGPRATSYYKSISPFDTEKYPVVRIDVVLPVKKPKMHHGFKEGYEKFKPDTDELWSPDNLHENLPNTLGWAMVQFVPHPKTGETVMFVGEQQSRWGQDVTRQERERKTITNPVAQKDFDNIATKNHPLLPFQHVLVLKAAAQEAAKRGVTKMIVSDGETAMMTEMHDKNAGQKIVERKPIAEDLFDAREEEQQLKEKYPGPQFKVTKTGNREWYVYDTTQKGEPDQSGGMRLHYDTTLTSSAKKLTGGEGEKVEMGIHKNAEQWKDQEPGDYPRLETIGSPIFKNPDGTPKASVTGTLYDLSKIQDIAAQQGGLTLGDPSRALGGEGGKYHDSPPVFDPTNWPDKQNLVNRLSGNGHEILQEVFSDPDYGPLAKLWVKQFPQMLDRVEGYIHDQSGSWARPGIDGKSHGLFFSKSVIFASPTGRAETIMHEMGHALTQNQIDALSPKHPMIKELESIRERAIEALPAKTRAAYDAAVKSGWLKRYQLTGEGYESLADTVAERNVIYGLFNIKELTAQVWNSPAFREHLIGINGKTGVWNRIVNWIKRAIGSTDEVSNTLLGELIQTTDQLMHKGEYLLKFEEFGEKFFASRGEDGTYGKVQTERAMGIFQETSLGISPEQIFRSLGLTQGEGNGKLERAGVKLDQAFKNLDEETMAIQSITDELGHDSSVRGVNDMVESALEEYRDLGPALDMLPDSATRYVFEKLRDHKDVLEVLQASLKSKNKLFLNVENPELVRGPVETALKQVNEMLKNEQRHQELAQDLVGLAKVEPRGFMDGLAAMEQASFAPGESERTSPKGSAKASGMLAKGIGELAWFAEPFTQKSFRVPMFAEINTAGRSLTANKRLLTSNALKPYGSNKSSEFLDYTDKETVAQNQKAMSDPRIVGAADEWIALDQLIGGKAVKILPETHPEIAKIKSKFNESDWEKVRDLRTSQSQSVQALQTNIIGFSEKEIGIRAGELLMGDIGGQPKDSIRIASELTKGLIEMQNPVEQFQGQKRIEVVQSQIKDPQVFLDLLTYVKGETEKLGLIKQYFKENPAWATAQNQEQFGFWYEVRGKKLRGQASSEPEARTIVEKAGGKLTSEIEDLWVGKEDEPFHFYNMSPEAARRLKELDDNMVAILLSKGVSRETAELARTYATGEQAIKEATKGKGLPGVDLAGRRLTGSEKLPYTWNHISFVEKQANYWARRIFRAESDIFLKNPELATEPELQKTAATHVENLLRPDPQVAKSITRTISTWFMGFNFATALIEASQPFVTHVSGLTAITNKAVGSYGRVLRAMSEAKNNRITGKWANKEHEEIMTQAGKEGQRNFGTHDELELVEEGAAIDYKRMLMKAKPQTIGQKLGTLAGNYSRAAMFLKRSGENFNADIALLTGFDLYREMVNPETGKLHTKEEALQKAYDYNQKVNFAGGRAARGVGVYSGESPTLRTAAMMGTALQGYVLGTTATFGRLLQHGFFAPEGLKLTPHEKFASRKALLQMAATQFAAAGLLGLPFVSGAMALLDKLFPDLEANRNVRTWMSEILSVDGENGSPLTDIAMTGLPSMLGWDMQSRLSMGNTVPGVSELNGFQPENLMGPAANIVKNFVSGVQGWSKGDPSAGTNFLPPAVRKMVKLGTSALTDETSGRPLLGEIRDYQGRPLSNPTRGEQLGLALGFQPKRLSDQNAASRIALQADQVANRHENQERTELAGEVLKGNFGTVRQQLLQRAQSDKAYNPQDAVKAIARVAEELTFPRDLRREGGLQASGVRGQFLSSFSNLSGVSQPSEAERVQFRQSIEIRLGLPPSNGRSEIALAGLMDQLRQADPTATRSELRAIAQQQLRRSVGRQSMLQIPEG